MKLIILLSYVTLSLLNCSKIPEEREVNSPRESSSPSVNPTPGYLEQFSGRGENEDGKPFAFHTYIGPNGQKITTKFEVYDDVEAGEKRFKEVVSLSMKVIETGPLVDQYGSDVGKRAVVQYQSSKVSRLEFKLLFRNGNKVHIIDSESFENLRQFEKEYLPKVFRN